MTQPSFVPITNADQVRPSFLQESNTHRADRPSEVRVSNEVHGLGTGFHGPDQGFALKLASRIAPQLKLRGDERLHDVEVAGALIASRRAASLGRAPTIYDLKVALGIFGFFGDAPDDLVDYRQKAFQAIGENYVSQRQLADQIPQESLALSPDDVAVPRADWRTLVGAG